MTKIVLHNRLYALKSDIYDLDEDMYDAAVVFVKSGYNALSADLHFKEDKLAQSKIGYVVFTDSRMKKPFYQPFIPYLRSFPSQQQAEEYIRKMVHISLDSALRCGNRIAFHGVQIHGMDVRRNEVVTVEAIKIWLSHNPNAMVTIVDCCGSFGKYMDLPDIK